MKHQLLRLSFFIVVLGVLVVIWMNRTSPSRDSVSFESESSEQKVRIPQNETMNWEEFVNSQFTGDAACADCHAAEFEAHQRSGHSHTAHLMETTDLGKTLSQTFFQEEDGHRLAKFELTDGGFFVATTAGSHHEKHRVGWLLGSGTHAQTAVSLKEDGKHGIEEFWTSFGQLHHIGRTPGQPKYDPEADSDDALPGRKMSTTEVINCFGCHMTFGPHPNANRSTIDLHTVKWRPNIGCERCHGPRRQHVIAARKGRGHLVKPVIDLKNPAVEMHLCSQCHRDETRVNPGMPESDLVRFQPVRLKQSRCYLASNNSLSCANCHDSHDATSHDIALYRKSCLKCHSTSQQTTCSRNQSADQLEDNCISCHMPKREWSSGIKFTDHWIRVVDSPKSEK